MLRLTSKYPYHGLTSFQRYESTRFLSTSYYYSQKSCPPDQKPSHSKREGGGGSGGSGGTGFLYTFGIITVATGATLAYAKYDPEFRRWLGNQLPWTDKVIAFVFQEDRSIIEAFTNTLRKIEAGIHKSISGMKPKAKVEKQDDISEEAKICIENVKERPEYTPPRSVFSSLLNQTPPEPEKTWSEVRVLPEPTNGTQPNPEIVATDRLPPEDPSSLPPAHPVNLAELEKNIQESAKVAVNAYREAACAAKDTSSEVLKLIDLSVHHHDERAMNKIKGKFERKGALIKEAEQRAETAKENICKLKECLEIPNSNISPQHKEQALHNAERVLQELAEAEAELEIAKQESGVTEEYAKKVEAARKHYIDEILILFPDMRPSDKEWHISKHDLDLFVYYCFQNVMYYQKELAKLETLRSQQISSDLKGLEKIDKNVIDAVVADSLADQAREMELDFQKRLLEIKQSTEKDMRQQLKRQAEAHCDHLSDVLAVREKELERRFQRAEDEKLSKEQEKFKLQLAGLVGRLQGLESALKARAQIDKGAHQAQVLWSACQALDAALKHSEPGEPWTKQLRPLENQINAVRKAALEDDELVKAVLDGIPHEARRRGVYPEGALRERFLRVEKSARSVALVPYEGASLPIYLLSYIQSSLLIKTLSPIPQAELKNEPVSFEGLDTYDILQRARYWIERGNIEQALRYMNLLTGASRSVASDWIHEARIYLETKQAAAVLMTHAAAAGLLYI